jgi:hypothetical protein
MYAVILATAEGAAVGKRELVRERKASGKDARGIQVLREMGM